MMYLHLRLLLTSLEVMMKLNHKLLKSVNIEMIDQCEKEVIQTKINSFAKCEVFGLVVHTPEANMHVGYKRVFVRKRNDNNEIIQYKA